MQTYSHVIITAALRRASQDKVPLQINTSALLLGSFLPDIPLVMLTAMFMMERFVLIDSPVDQDVFGAAYDALYFNDPVWLVGHALFHAPLMILAYAIIGYWFGIRGGQGWAHALFWFAMGCGLHSAIDIVTHHHDGPLLLFPFDWQTRFPSPISYWDRDHYGGQFTIFEHLLDIGLLIWLWVHRRKQHREKVVTPPS